MDSIWIAWDAINFHRPDRNSGKCCILFTRTKISTEAIDSKWLNIISISIEFVINRCLSERTSNIYLVKTKCQIRLFSASVSQWHQHLSSLSLSQYEVCIVQFNWIWISQNKSINKYDCYTFRSVSCWDINVNGKTKIVIMWWNRCAKRSKRPTLVVIC